MVRPMFSDPWCNAGVAARVGFLVSMLAVASLSFVAGLSAADSARGD